jgi:hypothetical protein
MRYSHHRPKKVVMPVRLKFASLPGRASRKIDRFGLLWSKDKWQVDEEQMELPMAATAMHPKLSKSKSDAIAAELENLQIGMAAIQKSYARLSVLSRDTDTLSCSAIPAMLARTRSALWVLMGLNRIMSDRLKTLMFTSQPSRSISNEPGKSRQNR